MQTHRKLEDLLSIPTPDPTDTWRPLAHAEYALTTMTALERSGIQVGDTDFTLTDDGLDMFGVLRTGTYSQGKQWCIGLRNSNKKRLAAGVCAGLNVVVCENLVFHGDIIRFRKHTSGLDVQELERFVGEAVALAVGLIQDLLERMDRLAILPLTEALTNKLLIKAVETEAMSPRGLKHVLDTHLEAERESWAMEYPDLGDCIDHANAYQLYQAITRTWRGEANFRVHQRSKALEGVMMPLWQRGVS